MTRSLAVGYLRAFITVLVVAHHALLAYHPFVPPSGGRLTAEPRWWLAFPVSDPAKTAVASLLVGFNDIFFMALMFLLSGLFVWPSLLRKGAPAFLRDRVWRLGVPFVASVVVLAPLAYYPSYLVRTTSPTIGEFLEQWLSLGILPAGPAWFLWLLLAFGLLAAGLFAIVPTLGDRFAVPLTAVAGRPWRFLLMLVALSAAAYLPLALVFGVMEWTTVGPFTVQTSRLLHYLAYFLVGLGLGAGGLEAGLLRHDGPLSRRWWLWALGALGIYAVAVVAVSTSLSPGRPPLPWDVINGVAFVLSCAVTSMALLGMFVRFARPSRAFDHLAAHAYGIYVVHYVVVSWLQYALLPAGWPGLAKAAVAFGGALTLSWALATSLRRVPVAARVI